MATFFTFSTYNLIGVNTVNYKKRAKVLYNGLTGMPSIKYGFIFILLSFCFLNTHAQTYAWKNVQINGGGFVSGLVYSKAEQNLLYARTDVGGAYRWDAVAQTWKALNDDLSANDQNYTGVLSIAADPSDANRVYLASGLYTASWAGTGAIFASANKGNTWTKADLTIKIGGNEDGRNAGERLMVDPNKGSILYFGSNKDGLWKSTDYAATWAKVGSFPVATSTGAGISFVLFDKSSATTGNATQTIYVGVLQTGSNNLYRSTDGGVSWNAVAGQPTAVMPHHAALASDGMLYISYCDAAGPNGASTGAVWKYNTITNAWTNINPPAGQGGFGGVTVDAANPQTIVVSTLDRWSPKDEIYRSTNGGGSWKAILTGAVLDQSSAPYTNGYTPHWIGDVQIDPFNNNKAWFITGYGVYSTANLTAADANNAVTWGFTDKGLEETVVLSLIAPPTGAPLISTVGDVDGFRHTNLDASPSSRLSPSYGTGNSIDFAQSNSNYLVRTYGNSGGNYGSWSNDQGVTWTKFTSVPTGTNGGGTIAISANASNIVWSPDGAPVSYSANSGNAWITSSGISGGLKVIADRVNAQKFYAYNDATGIVLISTNGGASFSTASSGLPTLPGYNSWQAGIKTVFGAEGDIWLSSGTNGLYRSVNSGSMFTKFPNVQVAYKVAFGKAATGKTYPTVYLVGSVNNVYGFYRSVDAGINWVRINDGLHQFGSINALAADANIFGRLYLGTAGRGIIYGDTAAVSNTINASVTDSLEIVKLYNNDNGAGWINKTNWLTAQPLNTWYGVSLDAAGNVNGVSLSNNNLTGAFVQTTVNNLSALVSYDVSNNALTGSLPAFSNSSLVTLNLRGNQLSGVIGTYALPVLQTFNLGSNLFTGALPGFSSTVLKVYNVDSNQITGAIPYLSLATLETYDASNNLLSGTLNYYPLPALKIYDIGYNLLNGELGSVNSYANLVKLDVSNNQFTGSIPYFNNPAFLQSLNFSHNRLSGGLPYFSLPVATFLDVSNNQVTGSLNYYNYPNIQSLNFSHNKLTGGIPYFNGLANLLTLQLQNNGYTFADLEAVTSAFPVTNTYAPQDVLLHLLSKPNPNTLLVKGPGGTPANNTYRWYTIDGMLRSAKTGDSSLAVGFSGSYYATVTNSSAASLTLYSDTLYNVLPVKLVSFTAQLVKQSAGMFSKLQWVTATEINADRFEVERSSDGISWAFVETVVSKAPGGYSNATLSYQYLDGVNALRGVVYYRLKQVDKDGRSVNSATATVHVGDGVPKIVIALWPNPVVENVLTASIQSPANKTITLSIVDVNGRRLYNKSIVLQQGANAIHLKDVGDLPAGMYTLNAMESGLEQQVTSVKFLKQ